MALCLVVVAGIKDSVIEPGLGCIAVCIGQNSSFEGAAVDGLGLGLTPARQEKDKK